MRLLITRVVICSRRSFGKILSGRSTDTPHMLRDLEMAISNTSISPTCELAWNRKPVTYLLSASQGSVFLNVDTFTKCIFVDHDQCGAMAQYVHSFFRLIGTLGTVKRDGYQYSALSESG